VKRFGGPIVQMRFFIMGILLLGWCLAGHRAWCHSNGELSIEKWKLKKIIPPASYTAQDLRALDAARRAASECTRAIESAIDRGVKTEREFFAFLYFPRKPLVSPRTFSTFYDAFTDSVITPIEDRHLARNPFLLYVTLVDKNGYVPSHNTRFAQPASGDRETDFHFSRSKRIYNDQAGYISGRNTDPHLLQVYSRDTGERLADLSVPVRVKGRHWGSVRVGYPRED
jgi:hypothetical protein